MSCNMVDLRHPQHHVVQILLDDSLQLGTRLPQKEELVRCTIFEGVELFNPSDLILLISDLSNSHRMHIIFSQPVTITGKISSPSKLKSRNGFSDQLALTLASNLKLCFFQARVNRFTRRFNRSFAERSGCPTFRQGDIRKMASFRFFICQHISRQDSNIMGSSTPLTLTSRFNNKSFFGRVLRSTEKTTILGKK